MHKRTTKRKEERSKKLASAVSTFQSKLAEYPLGYYSKIFVDDIEETPFFSTHKESFDLSTNTEICSTCNISFDWDAVPLALDPGAGELIPLRALRKRQQLSSVIHVIEQELLHCPVTNPIVIDFGAGSGHLGLLVAYRNPNAKIILAERKDYSITVAKERILGCSLNNVDIFSEDIRNFNMNFNFGISLHSCGLLTDIIIRHCMRFSSSFVLVPCCYGQISNPPPSLEDEIISPSIHRSYSLFQQIPHVLPIIASGADYSNVFDEIEDQQSDINNDKNTSNDNNNDIPSPPPHEKSTQLLTNNTHLPEGFLIAKKCMRIIDFDRAYKVLETDDSYIYNSMQWVVECHTLLWLLFVSEVCTYNFTFNQDLAEET
eukprot:gene9390-19485_t